VTAASAVLDPASEISAAALDAAYSALASRKRREVLRILNEAERNEHWAEERFGERAAYFRGSSCCSSEVCACGLAEWLHLAPSTVSHHMHRLIEAGLVSMRKEGTWVYYSLQREALKQALLPLLELAS